MIARMSCGSTSRIPFSSLARAARNDGCRCWFLAMTWPSFCRPGTFAISRNKRASAVVLGGSSICSRSFGASRAGDSRAMTNIMASRTGGRHLRYAFGTNLSTGTIPSTIHRAITSRSDSPMGLRSAVSIARVFSALVAPGGRKFSSLLRNSSGERFSKPAAMVDRSGMDTIPQLAL